MFFLKCKFLHEIPVALVQFTDASNPSQIDPKEQSPGPYTESKSTLENGTASKRAISIGQMPPL